MRIGVLGTGMVGRAISGKLRELGHDVQVGSRTAGEGKVPFAEAAAYGEVVFNCTAGGESLDALAAAGAENLAGKLLVDVSNPLDFSGGGPALLVANTDSLGEQIQRAVPEARVVKSLNTMNCRVMVDPGCVPGDHVVFVRATTTAPRRRRRACSASWAGHGPGDRPRRPRGRPRDGDVRDPVDPDDACRRRSPVQRRAGALTVYRPTA